MSLPPTDRARFDYSSRDHRGGVNHSFVTPFSGFDRNGLLVGWQSDWTFLSRLRPQLATDENIFHLYAAEQERWNVKSITRFQSQGQNLSEALRSHALLPDSPPSILPTQAANPSAFSWFSHQSNSARYTAAVWPPLGLPFEQIIDPVSEFNGDALGAGQSLGPRLVLDGEPHHVFVLTRGDLEAIGGCIHGCPHECYGCPHECYPDSGAQDLSNCATRYSDDCLRNGSRAATTEAAPFDPTQLGRNAGTKFPFRLDSPPVNVIFSIITTARIDPTAVIATIDLPKDQHSPFLGLNLSEHCVFTLTWDGFARRWSHFHTSHPHPFTASRDLRHRSIFEGIIDFWDIRQSKCSFADRQLILLRDRDTLLTYGIYRDPSIENCFAPAYHCAQPPDSLQSCGRARWWPMIQ
jgi:hypothetical protein